MDAAKKQLVIDSMDAAKIQYTAKHFYVQDTIENEKSAENIYAYNNLMTTRISTYQEQALKELDRLLQSTKDFWESLSWVMIARQPTIRDSIIESLHANPSKSFEQVAQDINNWCSASTIHTFVYHKKHIEKFMAIACTTFAFDLNIENGGHGLQLGLYRVQRARIAKKKNVRQDYRTEKGQMQYDGEIVWMNGDVYLVDCNVTGSDTGTSDKPKFSLMSLFNDVIFPMIKGLVESMKDTCQ